MKITLKKPKALSIQLCPSNKGYLRKDKKPCKLGKRPSGPYKVLQTRVNDTLELRPDVSEKLNMRRVMPYKEPTAT
jgi:hypothetical protein